MIHLPKGYLKKSTQSTKIPIFKQEKGFVEAGKCTKNEKLSSLEF
jgi:hypothetical protein